MPLADVLVVGHGLAGALLAWELDRAGIRVRVANAADVPSTSAIAAGILNPVTGRRLVKTWQAETLLPLARSTYQAIEAQLGVRVWSDLRIRRLFADEGEQRVFSAKQATGELTPYVGASDTDGFAIEGGGRVDCAALLDALGSHSRARGLWADAPVDPFAAIATHDVVIDCRGLATACDARFNRIPWEFSKGELLDIETYDLDPNTVLNCRHWVLSLDRHRACVGATHEPGSISTTPSDGGRVQLESAAGALLGRRIAVTGQRAGVRVTLRDKRPVAGWCWGERRLGLVNALGAKGAMLAPWLARQWVQHLVEGAAFDASVDVTRFISAPVAPPA